MSAVITFFFSCFFIIALTVMPLLNTCIIFIFLYSYRFRSISVPSHDVTVLTFSPLSNTPHPSTTHTPPSLWSLDGDCLLVASQQKHLYGLFSCIPSLARPTLTFLCSFSSSAYSACFNSPPLLLLPPLADAYVTAGPMVDASPSGL